MTQVHHTIPSINNPPRAFSHLKTEERYVIERMRKNGETLEAIARVLGKHKSAISREIRRGLVEQKTTRGKSIMKYSGYTGQLVYKRHRMHCKPIGKRQKADAFVTAVVDQIKGKKLALESACAVCQKKDYGPVVCSKT